MGWDIWWCWLPIRQLCIPETRCVNILGKVFVCISKVQRILCSPTISLCVQKCFFPNTKTVWNIQWSTLTWGGSLQRWKLIFIVTIIETAERFVCVSVWVHVSSPAIPFKCYQTWAWYRLCLHGLDTESVISTQEASCREENGSNL